MAGAITQRQPGSSTDGAVAGAGAGQVYTASKSYLTNSIHVSGVATRLAMHIGGQRTDPYEFFQLCLALARGIDYAVANNEVPARAQELPIVLKQSACRNGWFLGKDNEELLTLANEIVSGFCSTGDMNIEPSSAFSTISKIISRFYPRMKMGHVLASLEVKPGYGAYVVDFNVPKNTDSTAQGIVRLFVAQTDSTETSSCIISPPLANFLLNGKGVDRRINVSMDNGPQFPTNVTPMLKVGTNLLQVIGQFKGNYIIIIAFTSVESSPGTPVLRDYVQPVAAVDSDSDIIEGPSRISLNCPISHTRIRTPVKGHLCKHHQCFDYDNFLEINSRRPSWRCAHCNQSVCYTDICIDQNMVKVLKEAAEGVSDVIISVDGSWKAACEGNDQEYQLHSGTLSCENDGPEQHGFSKNPANVMDLTGEDDEGYSANLCETEDRKPFRDNFHGYSVPPNLNPAVNTAAEVVVNSAPQIIDDCWERFRNSVPQFEDDFWERMFLSTSGATLRRAASSSMVDTHVAGGTSEFTPTNFMPSPVLTDAISPALNCEAADAQGSTQLTIPVQPDQFSAPYMQLQPSQFGNSIVSSETGRPAIPRNISRSPVAIQALPAQTQVPNSNQRVRSNMSSLLPNGAPPLSQSVMVTDGFNAVGGETERQQQSSRLLMNPLATADIAPIQHPSMLQRWGRQRPRIPTQSLPQGVGLPATSQGAGYYRSSSQLTQQQQPPSWRLAQNMNQPSNLVQPAPHFAPTPSTQLGGQPRHSPFLHSPSPRPPPAFRTQQMPVQLQLPRAGSSLAMPMGEQRGGNMVQPASRSDVSVEVSSEQNWHPTGRMRGSLTGSAYSAALSQYMGQPTPSAPVSRTTTSQSSNPSGTSQLQVPANSFNTQGSPQQAYLRAAEVASRPGSLGALPGRFRGTQ
ncbi:E4 SUMO-protein ligase PIAL1-like isoform X3 [Telopea speciosissima]|uniref:E4 SUMO-protein ligase PIAL1-like isoform X3 n=1 Tax=Telopea speciosissima TaxID=54955 RepID=UPI001CC621CA|nr:E4 SUMO-protein ligase PIAL1-like isoform X3 [Telopea speciosissima]